MNGLDPERPAISARCAQCAAPLAHDQRYCVECGVRRGPVPRQAAEAIRALAAGSPTAGSSAAPRRARKERDARQAESGALTFLSSLTARAAGVAVMSMLAFGVVVGSGASSLAANSGAPLLVAVSPKQTVTPATSGSGRSAATAPQNGGTSSGPQTVTQTIAAQTVTAPAPATSTGGGGSSPTPAATGPPLPPVKHLFLVMLSDQGYQQSFGPHSDLPYLAHTLRRKGELLANYYGVAQSALANAIALISGQGPTLQTSLDCPVFTDISPATTAKAGQVIGAGCGYPATTQTLMTQLTAKGDTWKAYVEGINAGPAGVAKTCRRPPLGAADPANAPQTGDPYVTWRNPFVYFQSLTHGKGCAKDDVGIQQLHRDLRSKSKTPSLSYIAPSPCDDGSQQPCVPGSPANPQASDAGTDAFLRSVVARIESSPAYKADGLIAITFDEAPQTGPGADQSACCQNPTYPNLQGTTPTSTTTTTGSTPTSTTASLPTTSSTTTATGATTTTATSTTTPTSTTTSTTTTTSASAATPTSTTAPTTTTSSSTTTSTTTTTPATTTGTTTTPPAGNGETTPAGGGGQVGLLLISRYVKPNTRDTIDYYNHYSLLRSIETLFGLHHLGYATNIQLSTLNAGTFNAYTP